MKKRFLSIVLTLALVLSLMPTAFATTGEMTVKINGQSIVGQILTAEVTLTGDCEGKEVSYQWQTFANGSYTDIAGETAQTYEVQAGDEGKALDVFAKVEGYNAHSATTTAVSTDTKLITCGSEDWVYYFDKTDKYYSNVTEDSSGTYSKLAFYNASGKEVSFIPRLGDPISNGTISMILTSATVNGALENLQQTSKPGVSVTYNASQNEIYVAPYDNPSIPEISIADDGTLTIGTDTYDTSGVGSVGNSKTLDDYGLAYSYDATNGAKLTINGVDGLGPIIQSDANHNTIDSKVDLELVLNVDTVVKCTEIGGEGHKAINVDGNLKITGKHDLTASSATSDVIYAKGDITVDVDNLNAVALGREGCGIFAGNTLSILGDTVAEVSGVDMGIQAAGIVLNHTGTVTVGGAGFGILVQNAITAEKTGGLLAYCALGAIVSQNADAESLMPAMKGSVELWTAEEPVDPQTVVQWEDYGPYKAAAVSGTEYAQTVKLGAVTPPAPPAPSSGGSVSSYSITAPANIEHGKVTVDKKSASSGETVTITVTPDKGYTLETLTVLDKNGKEVEVKNLGNNKYTFKMPSGKVTVSATFMEDNSMLNFFVDVYANDYYYDAVLWAAKNGITTGADATHFNPNGGTTRAHVVTFLWRAAGCPEAEHTAAVFKDVSPDAYYVKAVEWALSKGITKGTSATTFSPNSICTRAQIAAFMARFAGVVDADCQTGFTDVSVNAYYASAVAWMLANGVTEGTTATTYSPDADCTRAQIVTFLYRWMVK